MPGNTEDLNALTEYWHRETNYLNEKIDAAFKSAQDDAYARGYRRASDDLIALRALTQQQAEQIAESKLDAERYRWATALDDNARILYSIVISHGGDQVKINERVDTYIPG